MIRAIVNGERDPLKLAKFRHPHCKKSEKEMVKQLTGHWREDHLFSLQEALKMYDALQAGIADYDAEILRKLAQMEREECRGQQAPKLKNEGKVRAIKSRGEESLRQALYRMSGVDVTAIDAIRRRNRASGTQRIRSRPQPLSHRKTIRPTRYFSSPQANQRKEGGKEEKTQERQYASRGRAAHRCHRTAPQPNRAGRLLPPDCAAQRRRCRGLCHGKEAGYPHLPSAPVGPTLCG